MLSMPATPVVNIGIGCGVGENLHIVSQMGGISGSIQYYDD
jgi:hypothetical protein